MEDLMLGFLHEDIEPFTEISGHHVHQAKPGYDFVPGHVEFCGVEEDEFHLNDA